MDEFTRVTGLHRKAVIRLINRRGQPVVGKRRGRKGKYGTGVTEATRVVWETGDRLSFMVRKMLECYPLLWCYCYLISSDYCGIVTLSTPVRGIIQPDQLTNREHW